MNESVKKFNDFLPKGDNTKLVSQRGKGKSFKIKKVIINEIIGIEVERVLKSYKFLPLSIFEDIINQLISTKSKFLSRGSAMKYKLGEGDLNKNSIEGYIAIKYYDRKKGDSVFRRISAISNILVERSGYLLLIFCGESII